MEEWRTYKIGDICDSISDTYRRGSASVVLVNTSDVLDGVCLNHTRVQNKDLKGQFKKTFKKDDILYSEIRPANKRFAYIDFEPTDYIASTKLMVIRSSDKVRPRYLFHFLKRQEMLEELQALAESRSGTFPQITFSELALFEIKLPSLETQDRIVAAIDSFENKIALNNRINHNLEEQASLCFEEWCSNCTEIKTIKELSSNILDYSPNVQAKVILLNSSDVTEGRFNVLPYVDNMNLKGQFKKRFKKGDVLYSEIRPRNHHYAICYFDSKDYIASTRLMVIRRNPELVPSDALLYQYLVRPQVLDEFTSKTESRSGTFPQGNYEDLSSSEVPYSSDNGLIAKTLDDLYATIWSNMEENKRLESFRDTLLPFLMSGHFTR